MSGSRNGGGQSKSWGAIPEAPGRHIRVLPSDKSMATYTSVKHWGDIKTGIPTQCMKLLNCLSEREETWSNVAHQINMKLGGTNVVVDHKSLTVPGGVPLLGDMKSATVVMGEPRR